MIIIITIINNTTINNQDHNNVMNFMFILGPTVVTDVRQLASKPATAKPPAAVKGKAAAPAKAPPKSEKTAAQKKTADLNPTFKKAVAPRKYHYFLCIFSVIAFIIVQINLEQQNHPS